VRAWLDDGGTPGVVSSPQGLANGDYFVFPFTDNSGTGLPDEMDGFPLDSGNITAVDD
jgi:hypothetical protein